MPRTHAQAEQRGRDRPGHPPTVSAGMCFALAPEAPDPAPERTGGALPPCRGLAPELLREPSRGRRESPARASLAATCSRPPPAPADPSVARRLRSRPRCQQAAAQLHSSTAGPRARRPRGGATARKPSNRVVGRAVPAADQGGSCRQRPQVQCGWAGGAGKGCAGMGGSAGSPFVHACSRLRKPAAASSAATQHGRSNSPPTRRC